MMLETCMGIHHQGVRGRDVRVDTMRDSEQSDVWNVLDNILNGTISVQIYCAGGYVAIRLAKWRGIHKLKGQTFIKYEYLRLNGVISCG